MIRTALLLIGMGVISFAVYLSGARLLERVNPELAPIASGLDPDAGLRKAQRRLGSNLDPSAQFNYGTKEQIDLARQAPLSDVPFGPLLIEASANQDVERMAALSNHVVRLNPRNRIARFVGAQIAVITGETDMAMEALSNLLTLNPSQSEAYLAEISVLAQSEAGQNAIINALERNPRWTAQLVNQLSRTVDDPEFLVRLFAYYPPGQNAYVRALADRGELERAHLTFLNYLPVELLGKAGVPFDGGFQGFSGAQPFNWQIHREYASFEPQGGLYISFFGQGRPVIATQTLRLSSGAYSAVFEMNGRVHRTGGHVSWSMTCSRSGEPVFELPITELLASTTPFEVGFEVPDQQCAFQTLQLRGVAGEFPRTTRALVRRVRISPFREDDA